MTGEDSTDMLRFDDRVRREIRKFCGDQAVVTTGFSISDNRKSGILMRLKGTLDLIPEAALLFLDVGWIIVASCVITDENVNGSQAGSQVGLAFGLPRVMGHPFRRRKKCPRD
jgi:hypothetical protein